MLEYIVAYICGGIIGWLIEYFINNNKITRKEIHEILCADTFNRKYLHICAPFLNIWGFGATTLLFINNNFRYHNKFILAFVSGLLLTSMECIGGHLSYFINKYHTWNYDNRIMSICNGYCSLDVSLFWSMLSLIVFVIISLV